MAQTSPHADPIVEILRLAYRRGLAIRKQQEGRGELTNVPFPMEKISMIKRAGSPVSEPNGDPTNQNGKEGL